MVINLQKLKPILLTLITFLFVISGIISYLIVERQSVLNRVSRYNLTWLYSQAATETLRFLEATAASTMEGSQVSSATITSRLNVLQTRLTVLQGRESQEFLQSNENLQQTVANFRTKLDEIRPLIKNLPNVEAAAQIRNILEPIIPRLIQLASTSNTKSGSLVAEDHRQLSSLHWVLTALMFSIMICTILLAVLLMRIRDNMMRQLSVAKSAAEAASIAKFRFLANMSHELRTPLNGVLGMIQMIRLGPLDTSQKSYAETALRSGEHLTTLISNALDVARIEANQLKLDKTPFSLPPLLADIDATLGSLARQKGLDFTTRTARGVPSSLIGDANRLKQVLANLINNAIKFTDTGHVSVTISCLNTDGPKATLSFEVRDSGIGIPGPNLAQIFEPFFQVETSATRRFGGSGLGLAIARDIVTTMGGTLTVRSTAGIGSDFAFTAPFGLTPTTDELDLPSKPHTDGTLASTTTAQEIAKTKILIVDDDAVSTLVIESFLKAKGFIVSTAINGYAALNLLQTEFFGTIIMDYQMPNMSGAELTKTIRDAERYMGHNIRIIGLSAAVTPEDRDICLEAGMDEYLTKPIDLEQLLTTITSPIR